MKLVNALSRFSFTCTNSVRTAAFAFVAAVVLFSTSPLFAQSSRQDSVVSQPIPGAWKFSPLSTFAPVFPSSSSSFSLQSQASRSSSDSSIFLSPRTVSADAVFSKTITNLGSPVLQNEQSQNNNNTGTGNTLSSAQTLLNAQAQQSSLKQDSNLSRVSSTLTTSQILSAPITNVGNVADQITTEIQALADSLGNSPARIFEYVYNAIEYEHYYGSKKGAHLTLLEGAGNDTDQCSLLVALLRASGYSSQYVQEWHLIPYDNVVDASAPYTGRSWLDLAETPYPGLSVTKPVSSWTDLQAKKTILLANFFSSVGFPVDYHASYPGFAFAYRTVVKTTVSSTVYYLDPSAKQIAGKAPANLATLAGFTATAKTTFLSNIGGTVSNNGITGVSFPNVKSNLTTYTNNFTTNLKNDTARRHDSVSDLLGRKLAQRVTVGAFGSWRGFLYATGSTIGDALPDTFMSKLKLSVNSGTETVILMPSLQGKRLAVTANGNTIQLRTDDATPTTLATVTAATYTLKLTAVHPNFAGSYFTENTYKKGPAYNYAIIYSFTGSKRFLDFRQKKLDALYREALAVSGSQNADGSLNLSALSADLRLKLSLESLNVTGLNWYYQTEMANQIAASLNNQNVTLLHRFGRMGQEEGFYIDVGLQYASNFPKDGTTGSYLSYGATFGYLFSALEHGVIDQYNGEPDKSVSTVQTFYRAITSSDGTKNVIYRGTSSNWTTVKNSLVGYATSALPATLDADTVLYVPKNANNGAAGWSWNGSGYASFSTGEDAGVAMIISGGYSGGYSPYVPTDLTVEPIVQNIASSLDNFSLGNTIVSLPQLPAPTVQIPVTAADPVDLATGAFTYDREDISLGSGGVRGLSFKRNYNSNRAAVNDARLGFGWTHNYVMKAVTRSAVDAGLGFTTAYEAAPILAAAVVINELVKDHTGPSSTGDLKSMVAAALVAKAAVDNLTNNAVAVQIGKDTYQFIKQPNGTYTPPAGSTLTLTETSTTVFTLQERHGNTYRFSRNNGGRVYEIEDPFGKKLLFTYNANGTIANIADACSRTLTFSYSNSLISSIADSTGRSVSFSYDANKNLTQISDPDTKVRKFEYDSSHRITYQRDPLDRIVLQNFYNANGQVTSQKLENNANKIWTMTYTGLRNTETDPLGNTKTYAYDKRGRVTDFWDARGTHRQLIYDGQDRVIEERTPAFNDEGTYYVTAREFDAAGNLKKITDPQGRVTNFTYDATHRLTQASVTASSTTRTATLAYNSGNTKNLPNTKTDAKGNASTFTYNTDGTLATSKEPGQSQSTSYAYNSYALPTTVTYPDGTTSSSVFNVRGDLTSSTDRRGYTTTFAYNNRRLLTATTFPNSATVTRVYDNCGDLTSITNELGKQATFTYSISGDLLTSTVAAGTADAATTTRTYYNNGWLNTIKDPLNNTATYYYDAAGNVIKIKDPLNKETQFYYDTAGALNATQTPRGAVTTNNYTPDGALLATQDPAGNQTWNSFNAFGERTGLQNRRNKVYQFTFDANGNQLTQKTPLNKTTTITYDARDFVASVTKPSGAQTTYTYNNVRRITQQSDSVGTINFAYDNNGNPLTVVEGNKTLTRTWDNMNRVTAFTNGAGETISYAYNVGGQLTSITYPGSKTVSYQYNNRGQLWKVTDWANRITTYTYNTAGRITNITRPNGTTRANTYNAAGQLTQFTEATSGGTVIASCTFTYDNDGNIVSRMRNPQQQAFTGGLPQLVGATNTYNDDNQLTSWYGGFSVTHDNDGNMTNGPLSLTGTAASPVLTLVDYTYDARNRLTAADNVTYSYDAENNRTAMTVTPSGGTAVTTNYTIDPHGDALPRVVKRTKSGITTYYVYGIGLLYQVTVSGETETPLYYHFDNLGSTAAITNASQTVTDRAEYGIYGHTLFRTGSTDTPFLYVGQFGIQTDPNTLHYMRARYYNPLIQRFINADPIGFAGGSNWYAYAGNNPMSYIDISGLDKMIFNGSYIYRVDDLQTRTVQKWVARSGRVTSKEGSGPVFDYSVERQKIERTGPIPAGTYYLPASKINTTYDTGAGNWDIADWNKIANEQANKWRITLKISGQTRIPQREESAWGERFSRLKPAKNTETYGRSDFNIHGGRFASGGNWGSEGCIDLMEGDIDFFNVVRKDFTNDVEVIVNYGFRPPQTKPCR